jgi:murein DD-endopeptidase MepM/ murein hydrolase activator NlpD
MVRSAGAIALATLFACGDGGSNASTAWDPTDATTSSDPSTTAASSTSTSAPESTSTIDPSPTSTVDPGSTGTDATTGEPYDCASLGYTGICDGDLLIWCEDDTIMMVDCAETGEVCAFESERIGYNCVPGQSGSGGFGYPVGDLTTAPAGGWTVTQVLGHYLNFGSFVGGHLAQDIANGEDATANASVHSVADGTVLYAGPNASTYVNVVLVEHQVDDTTICSFYGHLGSVTVATGDVVSRGDQLATVLDWQAEFGEANSHLHYVLLSADLCAASDAANGALICGYDDTPGPNGIDGLDTEPATYTSVGDACGDHQYPEAFLSPSQFIAAHHF